MGDPDIPPDLIQNVPAKARGRPFNPGKSGNPAGRPKGARNKATMAAEALLDGDAEVLTRKVIEKAKDGDMAALRFCLERLCPPRRDRLVNFEMPKIESAQDAAQAASAVMAACAAGQISPGEATEIMTLVTSYVRMLETSTIEARLTALQSILDGGP